MISHADNRRESLVTDNGASSFSYPGAVLTADLGAVRSNYRLLRDRLGPGSQCSAVLKADAYGLGADRVAPVLWAEGCRSFFVALFDEGVRLRPRLPDASIYVLNGLPHGAEAECAAAGLIPVLNSWEQCQAWSQCARHLGRTLPAIVQVDSGMNRFGWSASEINAWIDVGCRFEGVELRFVISHLACADAPDDPANAVQLDKFLQTARYFPGVPKSLANSSGIFLGADYHGELVRPGAALYGINPTPGHPNPMRRVVGLTAQVVQIREAGKGDRVGYGGDWRIDQSVRLATLSIGYADGIHRALHERGHVYFEGEALRIAGRISMDCMSVDVTSVPAERIFAGSSIEVIGKHQSVDDLADAIGSIGYEVLTSLGRRFRRIYRGGQEPVHCPSAEEIRL
jgi:alanine racemase